MRIRRQLYWRQETGGAEARRRGGAESGVRISKIGKRKKYKNSPNLPISPSPRPPISPANFIDPKWVL
ncbi:MAG: hypothetical protein AB4080_18985 [Trichodesmium sp.]